MNQEAVDRIAAQNLLSFPGGLVAQFSKIDLPQTIEMGDRGKVTVQLINQGPAQQLQAPSRSNSTFPQTILSIAPQTAN
jgi:hypothetical protein